MFAFTQGNDLAAVNGSSIPAPFFLSALLLSGLEFGLLLTQVSTGLVA
jgi:hypothetical protein